MYFMLFLTYSVFVSESEEWIKARSLKEFQQTIQKQVKEKELRTLCFLQLKRNKVPYSCYEWKKQFKEKSLNTAYLDEKCHDFSENLKNLKQVRKILSQKSLSLSCRKRITQQKEHLEYLHRDLPVEKLFSPP